MAVCLDWFHLQLCQCHSTCHIDIWSRNGIHVRLLESSFHHCNSINTQLRRKKEGGEEMGLEWMGGEENGGEERGL